MPPKKKKQAPTAVDPEARDGKIPSPTPLLKLMGAALGLCLLVVIAYSNSLTNGFVWDDHQQIVLNPYMKSGAPIAPIFTSDVRFAHEGPSVQTGVYRPLQMLTYRLLNQTFGSNPTAFHATNMAFAAAGAVAAFAVLWLLTRRFGLAFAAAALFAVHPAHTEAIDWIASSPDLGYGLFALLAFAFFLAPRNRRGWLFPTLSCLFFAIALLWKESAIVFPALLAAYVLIVPHEPAERETSNRVQRALMQTAPYWAILAVYLGIRTSALNGLAIGPRDWALTPLELTLNAVSLMFSYWLQLAWPLTLNAYHVFHPLHSLDPHAGAAIVFVVAVIVAIIYGLRRVPLASFAAVWVMLALLPAMNLSALGRTPFAERYLYLSSVGFCLLAVLAAQWLLTKLSQAARKPVAVALTLAIVASFLAQTIQRNPDWKDDETLFTKTLTQSPDAPFLRVMVADKQSDNRTQSTEAAENYQQAITLAKEQIPPDRIDQLAAEEGLASLYANQAQFDRALAILAEANQLSPHNPEVAGQIGITLAQQGRASEAEPQLQQALAARPDNEQVLSALGAIARDVHHDFGQATKYFDKALAVHPEQDGFNAAQHNNLGATYGYQGEYEAAISEFQSAVAIAPAEAEYHDNLATAYAATGRHADAQMQAETALRLAPDDQNARDLLHGLPPPR